MSEPDINQFTQAVLNITPLQLDNFLVPEVPTQQGPEGIRYDFNDGCRVLLPPGEWHVEMVDSRTGHSFGQVNVMEGMASCNKKYFIPFTLRVSRCGVPVMEHHLSLKGQPVRIQIPGNALGDTLAWMPSVVRFQQQHECRLTCRVAERFIPLFESCYPHIRFIAQDASDKQAYYANYFLMAAIGDTTLSWTPVDYRQAPLHHLSSHILGLNVSEQPARYYLPDEGRPVPERYVCIAVQSTGHAKHWNNPSGWVPLVAYLRNLGYRVICIDREKCTGNGLVSHQIPWGAEDQTGDRPLSERLRWLEHADFFIGLSSGLSWLAWMAGTPAVMISGFTLPTNEFLTPYRVINPHVCNGCWNDMNYQFNNDDYLWCPRHKGDERQFECTRSITATQVINVLKTLPILVKPHSADLAPYPD